MIFMTSMLLLTYLLKNRGVEELSKIINKNNDKANLRRQNRENRHDITVFYEEFIKSKQYPFLVELLNISSKGIAFKCTKSLKRKSLLNLSLNFLDGKTFSLKGRIAHKNKEKKGNGINKKSIVSGLFEVEPNFFLYGIEFEHVDSNFVVHLLKSKIQKHYNRQKYNTLSPN